MLLQEFFAYVLGGTFFIFWEMSMHQGHHMVLRSINLCGIWRWRVYFALMFADTALVTHHIQTAIVVASA